MCERCSLSAYYMKCLGETKGNPDTKLHMEQRITHIIAYNCAKEYKEEQGG
jgi:hypothetical protein